MFRPVAVLGEMKDGRRYGYGLVVLLLVYCGLRWGELSGLRVGDLNLDLDLDAKHPRGHLAWQPRLSRPLVR